MVTDINDTHKMMTMMTMVMMMRIMQTQYGHNSANFEATTSRFCMVIDLNKTYMMMMMMLMRMMRMMKMKLIIPWPILKLQPPDCAW